MPIPAIAAAAPAVASGLSSWLPAIGGVLGGIGSIFGGKSQKDANEQNAAFQREFAQHGIQWKVADAKAAGLHPLYALGGSGATFTPSAQAIDYGKIGQDVGRAAAAFSSDERNRQAAAAALSADLVRAQTRQANATAAEREMATQMAANEEARRAQMHQWSLAPPMGPYVDPGPWADAYRDKLYSKTGPKASVPPTGAVEFKPDEVISGHSGDASRTAGTHSFWQKYQAAPGFWMELPRSSDPSESLENLSIWNLPGVLKRNSDVYGPMWSKEFLEKIYGIRIPTLRESMNRNLPGGSPRWLEERLPGRWR